MTHGCAATSLGTEPQLPVIGLLRPGETTFRGLALDDLANRKTEGRRWIILVDLDSDAIASRVTQWFRRERSCTDRRSWGT